jgi:23S rRNA (uridine2552-2'-O)-methyltransferase
VDFVQGDFTQDSCLKEILALVEGHDLTDPRCVDLVLSDMAPNLSGMAAIDR